MGAGRSPRSIIMPGDRRQLFYVCTQVKTQVDKHLPVPVVLITCGAGEQTNLFTLNRITSCNAKPPMVSISVRPSRTIHDLID
jgi:hypothetical protein